VAGLIRPARGIQFPDGTIQQTAAAAGLRARFVPSIAVSGTGTTNAIPKWTDTAGSLGDSTIAEVGGRLGIGTLAPGALLHVFGSATSDAFAGLGPNVTTGPAMNYGYSGNSFGRGSGFFNVRPDGAAVAPNPSLRFMTGNTQRIIITNLGNIGINTGFTPATAPTERLEVAGNIKLLGPGTHLTFADASQMSTAGATLGANTFNGDQNVVGTMNAAQYNIGGQRFLSICGPSAICIGSGAAPNNTGQSNVFIGELAGAQNTGGIVNTFVGWWAGKANTTGQNNSFFGAEAGVASAGNNNSFFGTSAGNSMTFQGNNSFFGEGAGWYATGGQNTFIGAESAFGVTGATTGTYNSVLGYHGAYVLTSGSFNTVLGATAGASLTTGSMNTIVGRDAGQTVTVQNNDTLLGWSADAGAGASNATAIGFRAAAADSNTLILGSINGINGATTNVNVGIGTQHPQRMLSVQQGVNIDQGNNQTATFDNASALTFGNLSGEGISSNRNAGANQDGLNFSTNFTPRIYITNGGKVGVGAVPSTAIFEVGSGSSTLADAWTIRSSARFKTNVAPIDAALAKTQLLRGVTFDYKDSGKHSIGFIAEEVAEIIPEAVERDENGQAVGLDYNRITPLLVESVKSLHRENEELRARLDKLERAMAQH
jgi:hypothetical protein